VQQTLANTPAGTTFTGTVDQGLTVYTVNRSNLTGSLTHADMTSVAANFVTNSTGLGVAFSSTSHGSDNFLVDLSASSSQRVGGAVYSAAGTVPNRRYIYIDGPRLTYSTYGVWHTEPYPGIQGNTGALSYGVESKTDQMRTSGTAAFNGAVSGTITTRNEAGEITNGNVRLDVDFTSGTISGRASNLVTRSSQGLGQFADIHFNNGRITGTSFAGTTTLGANSTRSVYRFVNASGTFGGKFYGPNAVEAAGSFTLAGESNAWSALVIGAFTTTSDPNVTIAQAAPPPTPAPVIPTLAQTPVHTSPPGSSYMYSHSVFSVTGPENNPAAASVFGGATLRKSELGFNMADFESDLIRFDTSPNSPQRVAPNQYLAPGETTTVAPKSVHFLAAQALTYSTYGIWAYVPQGAGAAAQPGLSPSTRGGGVMAYGHQTLESQMPIVGSARYTGTFAGFFAVPGTFGTITSGDVQIDANFASQQMTGSISNVRGIRGRTVNPTLEAGRLNDIALAGDLRITDYVGTSTAIATAGVMYDITGAAGTLSGAFYGPNAAETAGTISMTGTGVLIQGAFAARP
jgi:hypothetical protein